MVNYWTFITSFGKTFAIHFPRNLWFVNIIDKHFGSFKETLNILYCTPGDLFLDNPNSEITSRGRRNPELIGAISRYLFWCWAYVIYHYSPMHNFREEGWIPFLDKFHHPFYIARFLFHKTHLYLRIWVNVTNSSLLLDPLK